MKRKKDKMVHVFTVIPNDFEYSTQHFDTREQAEAWARTYKSGASVIEQDMPERIVGFKNKITAKKGYKI